MNWVAEELWDVDLGDARRNRRLVKIVEDLVAQPNESVPQASRDEAAVQGVYEFWDNARVSDREILSPHQRRTVERAAGYETVLAIQDTSEVD
uniref:IS4/Tn5 family transposase DNA-binding protein n=1 Tax=Trichocoleus desertorum TaxID=1481672 RepID=UPI0025B32705|nr:transposase [Trichocoleus desertorum]